METKRLLELCEVIQRDTNYSVQLSKGMFLSKEIIDYEFDSAFEQQQLDPKQFAIPQIIRELCYNHYGFDFRWQYKPQIEKGYCVMGTVSYTNCHVFVAKSIEHNCKRLFLFDNYLDKWRIYIELGRDSEQHRLLYYNEYENTFLPMRIRAEEYVQKTILCLGLTGWHDFFMEDPLYEMEEGDRKRFKQFFSTIFPEISFSDFIKTEL